jgi:hypothetical protein
VLDKFDQPLKNAIAVAPSLEELVARYEPVRKDVERVKAERRAADPKTSFENEQDTEPFKSERSLRDAISNWEDGQKEIHSLRFYWFVGLLVGALGLGSYYWLNRWVGLTLLIVAFSEFIYWTCPTFIGPTTREFDRLLVNKLTLSVVSVLLLAFVIQLLGVFRAGGGEGS